MTADEIDSIRSEVMREVIQENVDWMTTMEDWNSRERTHCYCLEKQNKLNLMNFITTSCNGIKLKVGLFCPFCHEIKLFRDEEK